MSERCRHLVIIPSYNPGANLLETLRGVLSHWGQVLVVDDGSTDASLAALESMSSEHPGLRVLRRGKNGGKGAAVLEGAEAALREGFTHALVMDADGQHPESSIQSFMTISQEHPEALVLGLPVFGPEAPKARLYGRKLSVGMVALELGGFAVRDPLFGFRVYPLQSLVSAFHSTSWGRRYDFDPELAVRMVWSGVPTLNVPATCRYISKEQGGVSHFHYVRDNIRMVALHTRLVTELILFRWWRLHRAGRELQLPLLSDVSL